MRDLKSHLHMYSGQRSRFLRQGEQRGSGFNPLVAGKREESWTRARQLIAMLLLLLLFFFLDCSRVRKPCFSDKSCTIDEKYRCSIQSVQLLSEKWQFFAWNGPEKYCYSKLLRVQDYFSILYLYLTRTETFMVKSSQTDDRLKLFIFNLWPCYFKLIDMN